MYAAMRGGLLSSKSRALTATGLSSLGLAVALLGCSKGSSRSASQENNAPVAARTDAPTTEKGGVLIPAGTLPKVTTGAQTASLPDGRLIALTYFGGVPYMTVEGTFADTSYARILTEGEAASASADEKVERVQKEINAALKAVRSSTNLIGLRSIPEVGYFRFMMPYGDFADLAAVKGLTRTVMLNPVAYTQDNQRKVAELSSALNAELKDAGLISTDKNSYSGLLRIGIKEFEEAVARDIPGAKIDGSSVMVGVTDTGVTYNHPAFENAEGVNRIVYMKEFTGEGNIFFSEKAKFSVRTPTKAEIKKDATLEDKLLITAEYLPPSTSQQRPLADKFESVKDLPVKVGDELRGILTRPGSGARLAIFSEKPFEGTDGAEALDINSNGSTDDGLIAIHVPSSKGAGRIYLDLAGNGDLTKVKAIGDFNATKETTKAFQERFGFDIRETTLVGSDEKEQDVVQVGLVGYDSGNHGSHVSGIIAARKTLQNDSDDTYARGVVPNANLMVNRVCANNGGCGATEAFIDLALNGAEVINMSLGGLGNSNDGYDVQSAIITRLTVEKNVLFVISAGNSGPGRQTVGSPSVARLSLCVGATATRDLIQTQYQWPGNSKPAMATGTAENDFMLFFSSRGPTAAGGFKPNVSAPGTELSTVGLNAFPGSRQGLDVYWGTSMAAPTAAGAAALVLDAAKKWNLANPGETQLPTDVLTLRSVIIESSKPFDVGGIDAKGVSTKGRYTWIDQGEGLINVARAWELLKRQSKNVAPATVTAKAKKDGASTTQAVPLDYDVRVLSKMPNGLDYTGTAPGVADGNADNTPTELTPRFGRGLWIDPASKQQLYTVQIARRLPQGFLKRSDAGDLMRQLNTTAETFALETTIYGATTKSWLKAGVLNQLDCSKSGTRDLTIIGQGATDDPGTPGTGTGSSIGMDASNLNVCVDSAAVRALPPGDHGAIVKAFRTVNGKREAAPAFVVPVYLTKSHKTLEGNERYEISGVARSFDVERNYVVVPEGTTVVNVSLTVPELKADGTGCAGVELMALEGLNTALPAEISPRSKAIASNCVTKQQPKPVRTISYSRANPRPGVWDLHVFGRYQFASSPYTLKVEYAKIATTVSKIVGLPAVLNGTFSLTVKEATFAAKPDADKSEFQLDGLVQTVRPVVKQDEDLAVPNADKKVTRSYDATVKSVTISTYGATGTDIDLNVLVCEDEAGTKCEVAGSSGTATDLETVTFQPEQGKFYKALVFGYSVGASGSTEFSLDEKLALSTADEGTITVKQGAGEKDFIIGHSLDVEKSKLLGDERFKSGKYAVTGSIVVRTEGGADLASIPVSISAKDDASTGPVTPSSVSR